MLIDMHEKEINDIKDIIFAMEVPSSIHSASASHWLSRCCTRTRKPRPQTNSTANATKLEQRISKVDFASFSFL